MKPVTCNRVPCGDHHVQEFGNIGVRLSKLVQLRLTLAYISKLTGTNLFNYPSRAMSSPSTQKVYVAVIGVGLIGTEFITQLLNLPSSLKTLFSLISITSSKHTLFSPNDPITDIKSWKSNLIASSASPDLTRLTRDLISLITPTQKVALVDNTSSEEIAAMYPAWLKAGINVITPNKKAFSGQLELYQQIENASEESGTRYLNEATVGAGLPVIRTLEDLVDTGDAVRYPLNQYRNGGR